MAGKLNLFIDLKIIYYAFEDLFILSRPTCVHLLLCSHYILQLFALNRHTFPIHRFFLSIL